MFTFGEGGIYYYTGHHVYWYCSVIGQITMYIWPEIFYQLHRAKLIAEIGIRSDCATNSSSVNMLVHTI